MIPAADQKQDLSFEVLPASFAQRQLWFLQELNPESRAYNVGAGLRIKGRLEPSALREAVTTLVRRHEVLRTRFFSENGEPVQCIADEPAAPERLMSLDDIRDLDEIHQAARLELLQRGAATHQFDLASGELFLTRLIRLGREDYVFFITIHHIVSDGWSVAILVRELAQAYGALAEGRPVSLPELPIQYGDFAVWQKQQMESGKFDSQLSYWTGQLKGAPTLLTLPSDYPRPPVQSFRGGQLRFSVEPDAGHRLLKLGVGEHTTPFMTLITAFAVLLYRYTGQEDLLIGTPITNRSRRETQGLIGCFVNALLIRVRSAAAPTFRELLRQVRRTSLAAFEHHEFPFELLVRHLGISPEPSHNPAFQVMFLFQNNEKAEIVIPGLKITDYETASASSRFDLSLVMEEEGPSFSAVLEYSSDLFEIETVVRFRDHFLSLLRSIGNSPDQTIGTLSYMTSKEIGQLRDWNATTRIYDKTLLVHDLVARHARDNPDAEAVSCGSGSLSYGELNARAGRLAERLLKAGTQPDDLVGICSERCSEWVVGLLAILKAGAGYVALDPRYPADRLQFMIEDSSPRAILAQRKLADLFSTRQCATILLEEDQGPSSSAEIYCDLPAGATSQTASYVVYTSGSTGRPKGVVMSHEGLLNLVGWHQRTYAVTASDRASQIARMGFDAAAWEIWPYLTAGASVHIVDEETRVSAPSIQAFLLEKQITIAFLPPVLAEMVLNLSWPAGTRLRALLSGSDRLVAYPREGLPFRYWNHYGPTEATVIVTAGEVPPNPGAAVPPSIGRPLDNTQIHLLDENLQQVPVLRTAELYIGGEALARGYLQRPDLTAERFIPNPLSTEPGARMYKTGDLARLRPDGQAEFSGRNDEQVKLRGFRIELGEIESILHQIPAVGKASVALKTNAAGEKCLVAYLVARNEPIVFSEVKALLAARVPDFMVPSAFLPMEDFPLSPNGKVDRNALPDPVIFLPAQQQSDTSLSMGEAEKALAAIWREVLQVSTIGLHDNFYDLGGHSLAIVRVQELMKERMKLEVPIVELFRRPTLAELAVYVEQRLSAGAEQKDEMGKNAGHGKSRADQRLRMRSGRRIRDSVSSEGRE